MNMQVMFKLTDYGKEYYCDKMVTSNLKFEKFAEERGVEPIVVPLELKVDENGYSSMQMWQFIYYFGESMHMGGLPTIQLCELVFKDEDLTEKVLL